MRTSTRIFVVALLCIAALLSILLFAPTSALPSFMR